MILSFKCFVALGHLREFLINKMVIVCVDVLNAGYHIISASCKLRNRAACLVSWFSSFFFSKLFQCMPAVFMLTFYWKKHKQVLDACHILILFQFHQKKAYNKCCISLAIMLLYERKIYLLNNNMWHDLLKCTGRLSQAFHQETLVYFKAGVWKYYMYETTKGANNLYFVD